MKSSLFYFLFLPRFTLSKEANYYCNADYPGIICLCRDLDGLDCDHSLPNVEGLYLYEKYNDKSSEGLYEELQPKCCSMGGGDYIVFDDSSASEEEGGGLDQEWNSISVSLLRSNLKATQVQERLAAFDLNFDEGFESRLLNAIPGDSLHQAIFWLTYDDGFDVHPSSPHLLQRYVVAALYFELGGALRWKTCWSGKRYDYKYDDNELQEFSWLHPYYNQDKLKNNTDCLPKFDKGDKVAWLTSRHECDWAFITCDRDHFITKIEMIDNIFMFANQSAYFQASNDTIKLLPEIGILDRIEKIDLRASHIKGGIPTSIGRLDYLNHINLYGNMISGSIPSEICRLSGLEHLILGRNNISCSIPSCFGEFKHMKTLHLGYNGISGSLPTEMGLMNKLALLNLNGTNIDNNLPVELCNVPTLIFLYIEKHIKCTEHTFTSSFECSNPSRSWFAKASSNLVLLHNDKKSPFFATDMQIGCEWLELHDERSCPTYGYDLMDDLGVRASEGCCYCEPPPCTNFPGWVDMFGDDCSWYEEFDSPQCPNEGDVFDEWGETRAKEACCFCGGGHKSEFSPSQSPSISVSPNLGSCINYDGWLDKDSNGCLWYEGVDEPNCPRVGTNNAPEEGIHAGIEAVEACCYCGGGFRNGMTPSQLPSISFLPTISDVPTIEPCIDFDGWVDTFEDNCTWYAEYDEPGCPLYGNSFASLSGVNEDLSASDACCYCGGGEQICKNDNDWKDHYGQNCTWYEIYDSYGCPTYGSERGTDNIPAFRACCWCQTKVPSAVPSITSLDPTNCTDLIGWRDINNKTCNWYKAMFAQNCTDEAGHYDYDAMSVGEIGISFRGHIANEACCWCGGGLENSIGYLSEVEQYANETMYEDEADCKNLAEWRHIDIDSIYNTITVRNCDQAFNEFATYLGEEVFCLNFFDNRTNIFAKEACCKCKDNTSTILFSTDSMSVDECIDIQKPISPRPEHDCEWFELHPESHCNNPSINESILTSAGISTPVKDFCCVCNGGSKIDNCYDYPGWIDSHPTEPYSCLSYEENKECFKSGNEYINFGHSANSACCACGGGVKINENIDKSLTEIPDQSLISCIDEPNWRSNTISDITCDNFTDASGLPNVAACLKYGREKSVLGVYASTACCACYYGYDVTTGGGYQGNLIGKIFRVGYTNYVDLIYAYNTNMTNHTSISKFVSYFSEAHGFGKIVQLKDIYLDYDECIQFLSTSKLDICIGPYKKETLPKSVNSSITLYNERYITVVRTKSASLKDQMMIPFRAFTLKAWIVVLIFLILMTSFLNAYRNTRSSIGGVEKRSDDSIGERLIVIAFLIFIFFTLTAYGGSNTASFVLNNAQPEFISLRDIARKNGKQICFHSSLKDILIDDGYDVNLFQTNSYLQNDTQRLQRLQKSDGCDAVVISEASLDANAAIVGVCDLYPLIEDEVATVSVVIPISPYLTTLGEEMKARMDLFIKRSWFSNVHRNATLQYFGIGGYEKCVFIALESNSEAMGYKALLFPLCVSLIMMIASIVVHCYNKLQKSDLPIHDEELLILLETADVRDKDLNDALESNNSNDISLLFLKVTNQDQISEKRTCSVENASTVTLYRALKHCMTPNDFSNWLAFKLVDSDRRSRVIDKIRSDDVLLEKVVLYLEEIDSSKEKDNINGMNKSNPLETDSEIMKKKKRQKSKDSVERFSLNNLFKATSVQ